MSPFFQKNRLALEILCLVSIFLLIGGSAIFIVSRNKKNNNLTNIDPSIVNDERIRQEQQSQKPQNQDSNSSISKSENNQSGASDLGDANSSDPIEKGKALSGGNCTGSGSKTLGSAPMRTDQMSIIIPYGLMAAGHVTPIDHQYYWGKIQQGDADMYDVLSPGDGKLVQIQYRDKSNEGGKIKGDYRGVIMYSCTFFSYFDLATSLSAEIQSQLPQNWQSKGSINSNINLKEGQVIGKVGGQSLDFAVWDTQKTLKNLIVATAYNNAEPWKINTVPPTEYFSDAVKQKILPLYANQTLKQDGTIDQDVDGKAVGNWFLEGTNGYAKVFEYGSSGGGGAYYTGHLSIVNDHLDPTGWVFSMGDIQGQPVQYAIKSPQITPQNVTPTSGLIKYEIAQWNHYDEKGNLWNASVPAKNIKMTPGISKGVVLVQMVEARKIKIQVFLGKTPSQVSSFTSESKLFDRGDTAKMIKSSTATK